VDKYYALSNGKWQKFRCGRWLGCSMFGKYMSVCCGSCCHSIPPAQPAAAPGGIIPQLRPVVALRWFLQHELLESGVADIILGLDVFCHCQP
jgi:hypothetical protein